MPIRSGIPRALNVYYIVSLLWTVFLPVYLSVLCGHSYNPPSFIARNVNVHRAAEAERNRAASCIGVQSAETRRAETLDLAESPASDALRCPEIVKIKYHPSAGVRCKRSHSPCPFKGYGLRRRAFVLQTVLNEVIVSVLPSLSNSRVKSFQPLHCL